LRADVVERLNEMADLLGGGGAELMLTELTELGGVSPAPPAFLPFSPHLLLTLRLRDFFSFLSLLLF